MSYVVGTRVRLLGEFTSPDTGGPVTPSDIEVLVVAPSGVSQTFTRSGGEVGLVAAGRYSCEVLADEAGVWAYQFAAVGTDATVNRGTFRVTPALVAP